MFFDFPDRGEPMRRVMNQFWYQIWTGLGIRIVRMRHLTSRHLRVACPSISTINQLHTGFIIDPDIFVYVRTWLRKRLRLFSPHAAAWRTFLSRTRSPTKGAYGC